MAKFHNYSVVFKDGPNARGFSALATTPGIAIAEWLEKTDYELEDLIEIREVFSQPSVDKFFPS